MARGQAWLSVGGDRGFVAGQETVAAKYQLLFRVPHYELIIGVLTGVELVPIKLLPRSTASSTKGYLAQAAYFAHDIGGLLIGDDVYFITRLVSSAQATLGRQFLF